MCIGLCLSNLYFLLLLLFWLCRKSLLFIHFIVHLLVFFQKFFGWCFFFLFFFLVICDCISNSFFVHIIVVVKPTWRKKTREISKMCVLLFFFFFLAMSTRLVPPKLALFPFPIRIATCTVQWWYVLGYENLFFFFFQYRYIFLRTGETGGNDQNLVYLRVGIFERVLLLGHVSPGFMYLLLLWILQGGVYVKNDSQHVGSDKACTGWNLS